MCRQFWKMLWIIISRCPWNRSLQCTAVMCVCSMWIRTYTQPLDDRNRGPRIDRPSKTDRAPPPATFAGRAPLFVFLEDRRRRRRRRPFRAHVLCVNNRRRTAFTTRLSAPLDFRTSRVHVSATTITQ